MYLRYDVGIGGSYNTLLFLFGSGGAFGLSPEMALALSFVKRARDLTIGLPVIALWQAIEGGRLMRRVTAKTRAAPVADME